MRLKMEYINTYCTFISRSRCCYSSMRHCVTVFHILEMTFFRFCGVVDTLFIALAIEYKN